MADLEGRVRDAALGTLGCLEQVRTRNHAGAHKAGSADTDAEGIEKVATVYAGFILHAFLPIG